MNDLESQWEAQEPSADFAGRVVAAAKREARPGRARSYVIGGAIVAAAAAALIVVANRSGESAPSRGDVTASERVEVSIGNRAVAVLEPGAHVHWQGDRVEQDRGDVFYRVDRGAPFHVDTPRAEATVLGTSFRISVNEQENVMKRRDVATGAIGAVAAAVVVVGVYEGKVRVSHAEQAVTLRAGESAVADERGVRVGGVAVAKPTDPSGTGSARTEAQLRQELADLKAREAQLEQELTTAYDAVGKSAYDLTPEDWAKLAERGEFKYQYPCFQKGGFRPSEEQLAKLGLEPSAADAIQKAYVSSSKRFLDEMRPICAQVTGKTGDEVDLSDCIPKLFQAIYTGSGGFKAVFKQVDEIRAGKRPEADATTPEMKMLLVFSGGMAPFEAELAKTFGADEAHRLAYSDELCFQAQSL